MIITAAVAADRAAGARSQEYNSQLPGLGGSDPWSSGGEDDMGGIEKESMLIMVKVGVVEGKLGKPKGLVKVQGQSWLQKLQESRLTPHVSKSLIGTDLVLLHWEKLDSIKRAQNFWLESYVSPS